MRVGARRGRTARARGAAPAGWGFSAAAPRRPSPKSLPAIPYQVEIKKTHYSQGDPVNTVSATGKMIGGGVPSPVKKKQQQN